MRKATDFTPSRRPGQARACASWRPALTGCVGLALTGLACREPPRENASAPGSHDVASPTPTTSGSAGEAATRSIEAVPQGTASAAGASGKAATASAASTSGKDGERIYAKSRFVWIQRAPGGNGWIGYLTLGGSVRLYEGSRAKARIVGPGCDEWVRVEPMGFVCAGPGTTFDPTDPEYVAIRDHAGRVDDPYPFDYGESIGAHRYTSLPNRAKQRQEEWDLDTHEQKLAGLNASNADPRYLGIDTKEAGVGFPALPALGGLVREGRDFVQQGSTVAWSKSYDGEGRTWLYTSDHALVPKDRVKPYPVVDFQGVKLGEGGMTLPIAFVRKADAPPYVLKGDSFVAEGLVKKRLSAIALTGQKRSVDKLTYWEAKSGEWLREGEVTVAEQRDDPPFEARELATPGRHTWLDISVLGGTLVAYEAKTPVFATLISPGRGGTPIPGHDPVSTASTPTGTFRVDGKFAWASMVSSTDANIVHSEVQYVQNFHGPHALHGAYWHNAWGEQKSGGCVNLSPKDALTMFEWTEPTLPVDWHGARSVKALGDATRVRVRP